MNQRIYMDNAATSWPKPTAVVEAVVAAMNDGGAAAGRGSYRAAMDADQLVSACRRRIAEMLAVNEREIVFAANGTHALNIALQGFLQSGDHVVATQIEHNSVLRPLIWLQNSRGIETTIVPCDQFGFVATEEIRRALRPRTRLVVVSHASNVTGALQDLSAIGSLVRDCPAKLLVDAAQTFGHLPIDVSSMGIDLLAASGHKGALGPLGTAFTFIHSALESDVCPLLHGGTGSGSELPMMPMSMPYRHEAGNINVPAIAGLLAALNWRSEGSAEDLSVDLANQLAQRLAKLPGVRVIRDPDRQHVPVISLTFDSWDPTDVANILDSQFGIQVRAGLHCAPKIHTAIDAPQGTVRMSLGPFNTQSHIDHAVDAITQIVAT